MPDISVIILTYCEKKVIGITVSPVLEENFPSSRTQVAHSSG